jgi:hypothetical protein
MKSNKAFGLETANRLLWRNRDRVALARMRSDRASAGFGVARGCGNTDVIAVLFLMCQ